MCEVMNKANRPFLIYEWNRRLKIFYFLFFLRKMADMPTRKHRRQLTTFEVLFQVEWRFHNRKVNRQPFPWNLGVSPTSSSSFRSTRTKTGWSSILMENKPIILKGIYGIPQIISTPKDGNVSHRLDLEAQGLDWSILPKNLPIHYSK